MGAEHAGPGVKPRASRGCLPSTAWGMEGACLPADSTCRMLSTQPSTSIILPQVPPDSDFDAAARWEGVLRSLPLAAGAAGIGLTLANRILSGVRARQRLPPMLSVLVCSMSPYGTCRPRTMQRVRGVSSCFTPTIPFHSPDECSSRRYPYFPRRRRQRPAAVN